MRVLGRLRLSRSTEESTSIERQREIIQQWADLNNHAVVGWASDIDVSGSVDPFDTPELGKWLNQRAPDWDIICAWKLDRLGRNAIQLNKLFGWWNEHGKTVVSCSESIDLGNWAGRMRTCSSRALRPASLSRDSLFSGSANDFVSQEPLLASLGNIGR